MKRNERIAHGGIYPYDREIRNNALSGTGAIVQVRHAEGVKSYNTISGRVVFHSCTYVEPRESNREFLRRALSLEYLDKNPS